MEKERKYRNIHKLLFIREGVCEGKTSMKDFQTITKKIAVQFLCRNHTDLDEKISDCLIGIANIGDKIDFATTRAMLLDLMNEIDRSDK